MRKTIILNRKENELLIRPNNLVVKSINGEQYSVPEYLIEDICLADLPKEISLWPYQYFDLSGRTLTYHVPLIIAPESHNTAVVFFPEQTGSEMYSHSRLFLEHKINMIRENTSVSADVYLVEEDESGIISMEYRINITGSTVKEIIKAAVIFDAQINHEVYNTLKNNRI